MAGAKEVVVRGNVNLAWIGAGEVVSVKLTPEVQRALDGEYVEAVGGETADAEG